jgi:(p)ppGpp synthase/HD superfamily hydrolase
MFSAAIDKALQAAIQGHEGQFRKSGERVPYAVHPLHVALMLARWEMEDEVLQAALLHDLVEDSTAWTLARIEQEFGARVSAIVGELTEDKSRPWLERKQRAVEHAPHLSPEAAAVKAADQIHNLRGLAQALRETRDPQAVWTRFNGGRDETLRLSRALVAALDKRLDPRLGRALRAALAELLEQAAPSEQRHASATLARP